MPPNWFCSLPTAVASVASRIYPQPCRGGDRWPEAMESPTNSAGMVSLYRWRGWTVSFVFPIIPREILISPSPHHQLVVWLMDCSPLQPSEPDLPNGFWQWLLIEHGDAPEPA